MFLLCFKLKSLFCLVFFFFRIPFYAFAIFFLFYRFVTAHVVASTDNTISCAPNMMSKQKTAQIGYNCVVQVGPFFFLLLLRPETEIRNEMKLHAQAHVKWQVKCALFSAYSDGYHLPVPVPKRYIIACSLNWSLFHLSERNEVMEMI